MQKRVEQLDQALAALGSLDGLDADRSSREIWKKTQNHVGCRPEENCRRATRALGKMEGRATEAIRGLADIAAVAITLAGLRSLDAAAVEAAVAVIVIAKRNTGRRRAKLFASIVEFRYE